MLKDETSKSNTSGLLAQLTPGGQGARGPGGGGLLPYKSVAGARREILKTPLKGTRILFYGRVQNSFPPLRGTNSITTNLFA